MRLRRGLVGLLLTASMAVGGTAMAADVSVTVDLTGPADRINHGQVVSNFVRALKEQLNEAGRRAGIGCLVRVVAQSSHGKVSEQNSQNFELTIDDGACDPGDDSEGVEQANGPKPDHLNGPGNGNGNAYGHSKGVGNPHSNPTG